MARFQNLEIDQGTSFEATFTVLTSSDSVKSLEGATILAQMRRSYQGAAQDFTIDVPDPTTGELFIKMDADQTSTLRAGRWVYDVLITFADGEAVRLVEGIVTVNPSVSRAM